jgi:hypothetical protein
MRGVVVDMAQRSLSRFRLGGMRRRRGDDHQGQGLALGAARLAESSLEGGDVGRPSAPDAPAVSGHDLAGMPLPHFRVVQAPLVIPIDLPFSGAERGTKSRAWSGRGPLFRGIGQRMEIIVRHLRIFSQGR